ncbi:hypothetical protein E2C01_080522 [Portunus trituberculatus]|uniref:ISXO2-like transposase domain-containing protein n=1 Tax=Portunus trituberculatus TaxID=210409 RepID=A0A5B7IZU3_PORTR|nr:hypothetical protein [Portunus trituberculatus]
MRQDLLVDRRRKYNRGRMLNGESAPLSEDSDAEQENNRNQRPWVFGFKQGLDCRYFWMKRSDRNTLIPIIERECAYGSVIHSDEWHAYNNLNAMGYHARC